MQFAQPQNTGRIWPVHDYPMVHSTQNGDSGLGCYHGREGFLRFSHARAVFTQSRIDIGKLLRPPYGERFRALLNFEIRS